MLFQSEPRVYFYPQLSICFVSFLNRCQKFIYFLRVYFSELLFTQAVNVRIREEKSKSMMSMCTFILYKLMVTQFHLK